MDFRRIGDQLAQRAFDEQKAEGDAFKAAHTTSLPTAEECTTFATLMAKIMGTAIVENVPAYGGTVVAAPNTGAGVDLPIPSVLMQVNGSNVFVDLWWKSGTEATAWTNIRGAQLVLATSLPLESGIADPGDTSSGQATARAHVHPDKDTAGGDLYMVDAIAADLITYYGTPTIGLDNSPVLVEDPTEAWDGAVFVASQGGYSGPY